MKFVLLFVGTAEDQDRWDSLTPDEYKAAMAGRRLVQRVHPERQDRRGRAAPGPEDGEHSAS